MCFVLIDESVKCFRCGEEIWGFVQGGEGEPSLHDRAHPWNTSLGKCGIEGT